MNKALLQHLNMRICKKGRILEFGVRPPFHIGACLYTYDWMIGIGYVLITFFYVNKRRFPLIDVLDKCFIKKAIRNDDPRVDSEFFLACDSIICKESASHLDILISCRMIGICIGDTTLAIERGSTDFKSVSTMELRVCRKYHVATGEYKNLILHDFLYCTDVFRHFEPDNEDVAYMQVDIPSMVPMAVRFFTKKALKYNNIST